MKKQLLLLALFSLPAFAQITPPCSSPSESLCLEATSKGEKCRLTFPKECGAFINAKYSSEASRLTLTTQGLGGTKKNAGKILQAKDAGTNKPTDFKVLGSGTHRSLGNVSKIVSKYTQQNNLEMKDQLLVKEIDRMEIWRKRLGIASCDEFARENIGSFGFFLLSLEENQYNPILVTEYMMKHYDYLNYWANQPVLSEKYPQVGRLNIGEIPANPEMNNLVPREIFEKTSIRKRYGKDAANSSIFSYYGADRLWYPEPKTQEEATLINEGNAVLAYKQRIKDTESLSNKQLYSTSKASYDNLITRKGYTLEMIEELQELQLQYEKLIEERRIATILYTETQGNDAEVRLQLLKDFVRIDKEILPILQIADQMGCFQTNNIYANACAWSPSIFLITVKLAMDKFIVHQDKIRNDCLSRTKLMPVAPFPTTFALVPTDSYLEVFNKKMHSSYTAIELSKKWEQNITDFNLYMDVIENFLSYEIKEMKNVSRYTLPSGKKTLGAVDSVNFGQELTAPIFGNFGGGLNISSGWYVDNLTGANCVDAHNKAEFDLYVTAFSKKMSVARLTGRLDTKANEAAKQDVKLILNDIDLGTISGIATNTFVQKDESKTFLSPPPIIFPVVGVPVTIKIKGVGQVGYKYQASGRLNCTASNYSGQSSLSLTPEAKAVTSVSASVDAGFVEVGIRGSVNVAKISHPVKSSIGIGKRVPGANYGPNRVADNAPAVFSDLDIGFRVEVMSGNVKAYLDYLFDSVSKIFSWPGFSEEYSIVKDKNNYSLLLLEEVNKP